MNITKRLIDVNYSIGRYGDHVRLIVLHTEAGYEAGTAGWFNNPMAASSSHYGVGLSGQVDQFVSEGDTAWHAGVWMANICSIGIEHEDNNDPQGVVRTDAQYEASAELVADIARRYGLDINRDTVRGHCEILNTQGVATHPHCPGDLDIDRIVALANVLLVPVVATSQLAGQPLNEVVLVTASVLRVHNDPSTTDAGTFANTPDGMVHNGDSVHIIDYIHAQDPHNDGRDVWVKTLNILNQSHWIWAGGTNFVIPAPTPVPDPTPAPPVLESSVVAPVVVTELPPMMEPVVAAAPAPSEPVAVELVPKTGTALLDHNALITNLDTNQPIANLVKTDTPLQIVGTKHQLGVTYLVTKLMFDAGLNHGIDAKYFIPVRPFDTITAKPLVPTITPALSDLPKHQGWIARFLHFITGVKS